MAPKRRGKRDGASPDKQRADNSSAAGPGRSGQSIEPPGRREERSDEIDTGTTDEDSRSVDESPEAVEERRESQSGPGAPGTAPPRPHEPAEPAADEAEPEDEPEDAGELPDARHPR